MPERLMSYRQVAELLDCSADTVKRLWRAGLIDPPQPYRGVGMRFRSDDVLRYLYSEQTRAREAAQAGKKPGGKKGCQEQN